MKWIVLELTPRSDGEDPEVLARAIKGILKSPEVQVFIPAEVTQIGEDRVVHYLMDGYAFVCNPGKRLKSLEGSRYVQSVLPGFVGHSAIEKMKAQIKQDVDQGIGVGDTVKVVSGPYRNLTATVIEEIPEDQVVQVHIKLRSKQSIVTLPRSFLDVVERTPLSGFFSRLSTIRVWVQRAKPIISWSGVDIEALADTAWRLDTLDAWTHKDLEPLWRFLEGALNLPEADEAAERLKLSKSRPDLLRTQWGKVLLLTQWVKKLGLSWTFLWFQYGKWAKKQRLDEIHTKLVEVYWFEDVLERLHQLEATLEKVAHKLAKRRRSGGAKVIQNVLVDGHNLAFRCLYAPGMSALADRQGRPTGAILGFLRSLGALKKRFPEARLYVAWDGSSDRRKAMFADYKANRPSRGASGEQVFDQIGFLKEVLPKFGIWQVYNPEEEADDVIATLVRGDLKNQHNVIYSTDKDFLALVTDTTLVLMPGAGSRKEILYDIDGVVDTFGVSPARLPQLRAFCGDTSDNIPGVPRVPKKVLKSLVQAHQTIKGVYKSGLTGVSEGQYERLRLSEPQVNLNLRLMSFVAVPVTSVDPDPDVEGVAKRLQQDVGINPAPILKQFEGG